MSAIENNSSRSIFTNNKNSRENVKISPNGIKRNSEIRKNELEQFAKNDSKIDIPEAVKDFSKIKKLADSAPEINNKEKIESLKSRINNGTYKINYDELSENILDQEF